MIKHQITILDLAKELNLSKSTVSRALTGHPHIHPETKQKVLNLAQKWDYQRNMLALSLSKNKTNTIGIIVPDLNSSFFPNIILGAQEIAEKAGFNLVISNSNELYETEVNNAEVMLANRVDGLLLSLTRETKNFEHLNIFCRKQVPIVLFNRVCDDINVPKVIVDDYEGAFRAVEHLIKKGRKRIAHLGGPPSLRLSEKRLNGYLAALKKYKVPIDDELILSYDLDVDKVKIYVNHLLNLDNPPDAIFAVNDPTAIEAIQIINKKRLTVPKDISVVGFSDDYVSSLINPPLTTVSQPAFEIGRVAAQLVIDQINKDISEWKPIIKVLETKLVVRKSG